MFVSDAMRLDIRLEANIVLVEIIANNIPKAGKSSFAICGGVGRGT